jgi:hypothetical protein
MVVSALVGRYVICLKVFRYVREYYVIYLML